MPTPLLFFFLFCVKGIGECQGREKAALCVCGLPPPERHQDPKSPTSPLGFRERQKTNPLRRHHTGTVGDLTISFLKKHLDAFREKNWSENPLFFFFLVCFCLFGSGG